MLSGRDTQIVKQKLLAANQKLLDVPRVRGADALRTVPSTGEPLFDRDFVSMEDIKVILALYLCKMANVLGYVGVGYGARDRKWPKDDVRKPPL